MTRSEQPEAQDPNVVSVRVLVADDDPLVRAGLTMMLDGMNGIQVVGHAEDGNVVAAAVARCAPDVVLMDLRMPILDGISATRTVRAQPNPPEVIMLSSVAEEIDVLAALRAGAAGYLVKDTAPPDIAAAIHQVQAGNSILSPTVTRAVIAQAAEHRDPDRGRAARQRLDQLSDTEAAVIRAVAEGHTNQEIADTLHLSVNTVKAYVSRALTMLGVTNRVQIALLVRDAE